MLVPGVGQVKLTKYGIHTVDDLATCEPGKINDVANPLKLKNAAIECLGTRRDGDVKRAESSPGEVVVEKHTWACRVVHTAELDKEFRVFQSSICR